MITEEEKRFLAINGSSAKPSWQFFFASKTMTALNPSIKNRPTSPPIQSWLTIGVSIVTRTCAAGIVSAIALTTVQATPAAALTYNSTPTSTPFASGFGYPYGIAVTSTGNVLVADYDNNSVSYFNSSGNPIGTGTFGSGYNGPSGITVTSTGNVLVTNYNSNSVSYFDSSGNPIGTGTFGSGYNGPSGITVTSTGNVLVTNNFADSVSYFDSSGNPIGTGTFGSGYSRPTGIVVDSSGDILVADFGTNRVLRFDSAGNLQQILTGLDGPEYMAIDSTGALLVGNGGDGTIARFTVATPVPFGFSPIWAFASFGLRPLIRRFSKRKQLTVATK